jgi:hypothetical protein
MIAKRLCLSNALVETPLRKMTDSGVMVSETRTHMSEYTSDTEDLPQPVGLTSRTAPG